MTNGLTRRDALAAAAVAGFTIMGGGSVPAEAKERAGAGRWKDKDTRCWRDSAGRGVVVQPSPKKVAPAQPLAQQMVSVINPELLAAYSREPFAGQRVLSEPGEQGIPVTGKLHG